MSTQLTPDQAVARAIEVSDSGGVHFNWAQTVLHVMQEAQRFPPITETAAGFGGGIGGEQDVCGAITGGVIAIGYREGRTGGNQLEIAAATRPIVRDLYEGFRERFGAVDCRSLIGYDFADPAQNERSHSDPERLEKCRAYKEWVLRRLLADKR